MNRDSNLLVRYRWSFVLGLFMILWVLFVENVIDATFAVKVTLHAPPTIAIIALLVVYTIRSGSDRR